MTGNRKIWKVLIGCLVIMMACSAQVLTAYCMPASVNDETRELLGLYQNGRDRFLIRERDGVLELLYDTNPRDGEVIKTYVTFPMEKVSDNYYRLVGNGPQESQSSTVKFDRDAAGRGIVCYVGAKRFSRHFYGPESGLAFRIVPQLPTEELKKRAKAAIPPIETGVFQQPDLVEIVTLEPTIQLDIRYATDNNFMGISLYGEPRAFLQRSAAEALVRVHHKLNNYGYGIVVYDAYRPWSVTKMFWDATPSNQKIFVADPAKGSRHNRGGAVDVGLYDVKTGKVISLTSDYDEFSPRAYSDFPGGTTVERWQRDLLRILMEGEGFTVYPEEWWHFDYHDWKQLPILNLPFDKIY